MPAKNSHLTFGNRDHLLELKFYKDYLKKVKTNKDHDETKPVIDYKTFLNVIKSSNKLIAEIVSEEQEGFKLPESLGYIVVTRYTSRKNPLDYYNTKQHETKVIHNNLHSNGDMFALRWFNKFVTRNLFAKIYKFKGCRTFTRSVAKSIKAETLFLSWHNKDFFNHNRIDKLYAKIKTHGSD